MGGVRSRFPAALRNDKKSGSSSAGQTLAEFGGGFAVAEDAEGAEIVEVALAAAFGYGADVVGVP